MKSRSRATRLFLIAACGAAAAAFATPAHACGGRQPAPLAAFPGSGATEVSPQSSIFVGAPFGLPAGLEVEANGQLVPLPRGEPLGSGPSGSWLRLVGGLSPSTSYVVRAQDNGVVKELTHFTTAASYDKQPGVAPKLTGLRLWRVHYPLKAVAGGGCVFSEYEGYIDLAYQPGAVPGTPPNEVINVLSLSAKAGGSPQTFVFTGSERLHLAQVENPNGNGLQDVPDRAFPSPVFAAWKPELEPDRVYCATLTLYGRNDVAALPTASDTVCAPVMRLTAAGASAESSGGCAVGGGTPSGSFALVLLVGLAGACRRRR
jgi:MYXO-CTERM domain-containing protein